MSVIALIRANVPEESTTRTRLRKNGCSLNKQGVPTPNLIVDLDKAGLPGDQSRADFLFVSDESGGWVVPIEMKRGATDVAHAARQLQSSANKADEWIATQEPIKNFCAVLASGGGPRKHEATLLRSTFITFGNRKHPIQPIRCHGKLQDALENVTSR